MRTFASILALGLLAGCASGPSVAPGPVRWDAVTVGGTPSFKYLDLRATSGRARRLTLEGVPFRGRTTKVFAYLALPEVDDGDRVPGVVLVHGEVSSASRSWAEHWADLGYAAIAIDTCGSVPGGEYGADERSGHRRSPAGGPAGWGGFARSGEALSDQWPYHAAAAVVRAGAVLGGLPEVDETRVGVVGVGWGGYLAALAASVGGDRFAFGAAIGGCGYLEALPKGEGPREAGASRAQYRQWYGLWDLRAYLPSVRCPFLWSSGAADRTWPLDAVERSVKALGSTDVRRAIRTYPPAGGAAERAAEVEAFADEMTGLGPHAPRCLSAGVAGESAKAVFDLAGREVTMVTFNWTPDAGSGADRKWNAVPVELERGTASVELPVGVKSWYFSVFFEKGVVASSPLVRIP